ncbi:MAG: hypothetical protein LUE64_05570 [Candidatus Gastranaerophilales bacterium]|nr:hypothetical protein [Candidatus Gastranaerophilales bacterium]
MKKFLLLFAMLFILGLRADAYQITTNAQTKRIPMGTKLELETASAISSQNVNQGDMFNAYLTRDVRTQTTMILPRGTVVRGNISGVTAPKMLSRSAVLYLNFDHVVAPNGSQLPISAGLCDNFELDDNGGIKGGGNYAASAKKNWSKSGDIIVKSTKWGISSGEDLFTGGKYLVTPFSAIGGTIAGAGYFVGMSIGDLFKKGNSVFIKKGEVFNIVLIESLDVPVSE